MDPKLFGREIIFEEFQPMWSRYLIVTDRQTDRQTDGRLTVASPRSALASRSNKTFHQEPGARLWEKYPYFAHTFSTLFSPDILHPFSHLMTIYNKSSIIIIIIT